jgi:hypothetical protein
VHFVLYFESHTHPIQQGYSGVIFIFLYSYYSPHTLRTYWCYFSPVAKCLPTEVSRGFTSHRTCHLLHSVLSQHCHYQCLVGSCHRASESFPPHVAAYSLNSQQFHQIVHTATPFFTTFFSWYLFNVRFNHYQTRDPGVSCFLHTKSSTALALARE